MAARYDIPPLVLQREYSPHHVRRGMRGGNQAYIVSSAAGNESANTFR